MRRRGQTTSRLPARAREAIRGLAVVVALGVGGALLPGCGSPPAPRQASRSPELGLFVLSQSPQGVLSLAHRLGVTVQGISGYTTGTSWATIGQYRPPRTSLQLFVSVDMSPGYGRPSETPQHLAVYQELARHLVSGGQSNAIVRVGWEWSAPFFSWGPQNTTPAQYVRAFRDIVTTMRSVPGQHFSFDWCANSGSTPSDGPYAASYPGNAYVDYIGTDQYDNPGTSWAQALDDTAGLAYTVRFAKAHGKRVSIPEWGLNGGDDPQFIDLMHGFITNPANDVAYSSYFSAAVQVDSDITQFPQSAAEFRNDFGKARGRV
ncbi:MAG: glycosyl hydrolase [Acidimicrobiales bacterium]